MGENGNWILHWRTGAGETGSRPIDDAFTVGRSSACDLVFDSPRISRTHARIGLSEGGRPVVEDLGSANGTLLNGQKADAAFVNPGDRLLIGDVELWVEEGRVPLEATAVIDPQATIAIPAGQETRPLPSQPAGVTPPPPPAGSGPRPDPFGRAPRPAGQQQPQRSAEPAFAPPPPPPPPPVAPRADAGRSPFGGGAGAPPAPRPVAPARPAAPPSSLAAGTYPVVYEVDPPAPQSRLTVFFRYFAYIPHGIILGLLGYAVAFVTVISWFAILFTGKLPEGMGNFSAGYLRWSGRATGYLMLLTGAYPPFALTEEPAYPIRPGSQPQFEGRNRLTVFFRVLMIIPHLIVLYLLGIVVAVVVLISWFAALFTGSVPTGMHNFIAGYLRWAQRLGAYALLLTDQYPPFSLE